MIVGSLVRHFFTRRWPSSPLATIVTLLLLSTNVGGSTTTPASSTDCGAITTESFDEYKDCVQDPKYKEIGNSREFVRLDFSAPSETEITGFFARTAPLSQLKAAIRIVGNKDLETLNLGNIETWTATLVTSADKDEVFLEIANNPKLKTIKWKVTSLNSVIPLPIYIYNNPSLTLTDEQVQLLKNGANMGASRIEEKPGVCQFDHPKDPARYTPVTQDLLDPCDVIKGDLDMAGVQLTKNIALNTTGACLRLVAVNMNRFKMTFKNESGVETCTGKAGAKSEIRDNPGLCGDELAAVEGYFQPGAGVAIQMEGASCTVSCGVAEAAHKYYRCSDIKDDVDISSWFENSSQELEDKRDSLKTVTGKITVKNSQKMIELSLPNLVTASQIEITDNTQLTTLNLVSLTSVGTLIFTGNTRIDLTRLKGLKFTVKDMDKSRIECDTRNGDIVSSIDEIHLCTVINGPLILRGLPRDAKPGDVHLKRIDGCITVEGTQLSNLDFLKSAVISCTDPGGHQMTNNANLCPSAFPKTITGKVTETGNKKAGCGNSCKDLTVGKCTNFDGDLVITSSTATAHLEDLETIKGSLYINGTTLKELDLPKLVEITASTAPALKVADNPELKSLNMKKLAVITTSDGSKPLIHISNNPKLSNLVDFIPAGQLAGCGEKNGTDCYYDGLTGSGKGTGGSWFKQNKHNLWWMITAAGVVICAVLGGIVVGCCLWRRNKKKKKSKETITGRGRDSPKTEHDEKPKKTTPPTPALKAPAVGNSTTTTSTEKDMAATDAEKKTTAEPATAVAGKTPGPEKTQSDSPPPISYIGTYESHALKLFQGQEKMTFDKREEVLSLMAVTKGFDGCMYDLRRRLFYRDYMPNPKIRDYNSNVHLVSPNCDRMYTRLLDALSTKLAQMVKSLYWLSIGPSFFTTNDVKNFKNTTGTRIESMKWGKDKLKPAQNDYAQSSAVEMNLALDDGRRTTFNSEVTQIRLPEGIHGNLEKIAGFPWYEVLQSAWRAGMFVHTTVPDYFILIYDVIFTLGRIYGIFEECEKRPRGPKREEWERQKRREMEKRTTLGETVAETRKAAELWTDHLYRLSLGYHPDEKPVDVTMAWIYVTMDMFIKFLEDDDFDENILVLDAPEQKEMAKKRDLLPKYKENQRILKLMDQQLVPKHKGERITWKDDCGDPKHQAQWDEVVTKGVKIPPPISTMPQLKAKPQPPPNVIGEPITLPEVVLKVPGGREMAEEKTGKDVEKDFKDEKTPTTAGKGPDEKKGKKTATPTASPGTKLAGGEKKEADKSTGSKMSASSLKKD